MSRVVTKKLEELHLVKNLGKQRKISYCNIHRRLNFLSHQKTFESKHFFIHRQLNNQRQNKVKILF